MTIDEVFAAGCVVESSETRVMSAVSTQEQLVSSKGVSDLTFTDGQVLKHASSLLRNLARHPATRELIVAQGAVPRPPEGKVDELAVLVGPTHLSPLAIDMAKDQGGAEAAVDGKLAQSDDGLKASSGAGRGCESVKVFYIGDFVLDDRVLGCLHAAKDDERNLRNKLLHFTKYLLIDYNYSILKIPK